mmetsp:Transcript_15688/g.59526  ORF Transcript_15688/g.59526 Transcript_15688/m.59526 type:complete len:377 (+) Transcript_15688:667-1797(+)
MGTGPGRGRRYRSANPGWVGMRSTSCMTTMSNASLRAPPSGRVVSAAGPELPKPPPSGPRSLLTRSKPMLSSLPRLNLKPSSVCSTTTTCQRRGAGRSVANQSGNCAAKRSSCCARFCCVCPRKGTTMATEGGPLALAAAAHARSWPTSRCTRGSLRGSAHGSIDSPCHGPGSGMRWRTGLAAADGAPPPCSARWRRLASWPSGTSSRIEASNADRIVAPAGPADAAAAAVVAAAAAAAAAAASAPPAKPPLARSCRGRFAGRAAAAAWAARSAWLNSSATKLATESGAVTAPTGSPTTARNRGLPPVSSAAAATCTGRGESRLPAVAALLTAASAPSNRATASLQRHGPAAASELTGCRWACWESRAGGRGPSPP